MYPTAKVDRNVLFVDDGNLITSAGTAAGIDACLHLVRRELGSEVTNKIARRMVVPPQRDGGQRQYIDQPIPVRCSEGFAPHLDWILNTSTSRTRSPRLARRAHMSARTFARRFVEETGRTPMQWVTDQRVLYARRLLEETDLDIDRIADRSGFGTATLLRHHFRRIIGVTPSDYRRRFCCNDSERGTLTARPQGAGRPRRPVRTGRRPSARPAHRPAASPAPVALRGVGQPGHVQLGAGDRRVVAAQHIQQPPADLPVGAGVALDAARGVRPADNTDRPPRTALNGHSPQRGDRAVHTVAPSSIKATENRAPQHRGQQRGYVGEVAWRAMPGRRPGRAPPWRPPAARWCRRPAPAVGRRSTRWPGRCRRRSRQRQQGFDVGGHHVAVLGGDRDRALVQPLGRRADSPACPRRAARRPRRAAAVADGVGQRATQSSQIGSPGLHRGLLQHELADQNLPRRDPGRRHGRSPLALVPRAAPPNRS